jgi:hypothetical protein
MAITAYSGTVPQRSNQPTTFAGNMDDWILWATNTAIPGINTAVEAFNFNSTNSTSTTSIAIGTGSKSITVQASKSYVEGMTVRIANTADVTKWMQGEVVSYNSSTGALVVNVTNTSGSGTIAAWTVSLSATSHVPYQGTKKTIVHTGNGHGGTNTKIRRFTTTVSDTLGSYADSAANGATFTIPEAGLYMINYSDIAGGSSYCGLSLNSAQLTTAFESITESTKIMYSGILGPGGSGVIDYFASGDVIRAHTTGSGMTDALSATRLAIVRLF